MNKFLEMYNFSRLNEEEIKKYEQIDHQGLNCISLKKAARKQKVQDQTKNTKK